MGGWDKGRMIDRTKGRRGVEGGGRMGGKVGHKLDRTEWRRRVRVAGEDR